MEGPGAEGQEGGAAGDAEQAGREGGVTLEFTSPDKPAVVTGSPGFRYLLAPMRT